MAAECTNATEPAPDLQLAPARTRAQVRHAMNGAEWREVAPQYYSRYGKRRNSPFHSGQGGLICQRYHDIASSHATTMAPSNSNAPYQWTALSYSCDTMRSHKRGERWYIKRLYSNVLYASLSYYSSLGFSWDYFYCGLNVGTTLACKTKTERGICLIDGAKRSGDVKSATCNMAFGTADCFQEMTFKKTMFR